MTGPVRSFESTLLRGLMGLLGVLALALAALTWWAGFAGTQELMRVQLQRDVTRLRGDLEQRLQQVQRHGEAVAERWASGHLPLDQPKASLACLLPVFRAAAPISALILVGEDGRGLIVAETDTGMVNGAELRRGPAGVMERYHVFEGLPVEGRWDAPGWHAWERPWYLAGQQAGPEGVWVAPYRYAIVSRPGLTYARPVLDTAGRRLGVLCLDLPLDALNRDLDRALPVPGSALVLSDARGRILLSHGVGGGFQHRVEDLELPLLRSLLAHGAPEGIQRQKGHLGQSATLTPTPDLHWRVALAIPERALLQPLRLPLSLSLLLAMVLLGVVGLRLRTLSRRLSQPLKALERAAHALGAGRPLELPEVGVQEVQAVGAALQSAAMAREERERLQTQAETAHHLQTLGRLAGGVAHQVNNHMAVVLAELGAPAPSPERIQKALLAARRCSTLATTLVGWTGAQPPLVPLHLQRWLEAVRHDLAAELGAGLCLELRLPESPVWVMGDPVSLEAALVQVLLPIRAQVHPGRPVVLELHREPVGVRLSMQGLPSDGDHDPQTPERFGLALAEGVLRAHGGALIQERDPEGTPVLVLRLPDAPRAAAPPPRPEPLHRVGLTGLRILLADDEPDLREAMVEALEEEGAQVDPAEDGLRAWALWGERGPYDLVVTDQRMPGLTGTELLARVREVAPRTPVLLVSGYGLEELRRQLEAVPTLRMLPKPFSVHALLEAAQGLTAPWEGLSGASAPGP